MNWRPRSDGDVDRAYFDNLISSNVSSHDILIYIFKNNKIRFSKPQIELSKQPSLAFESQAAEEANQNHLATLLPSHREDLEKVHSVDEEKEEDKMDKKMETEMKEESEV
jgi:hypothetical protein